MSAASEGPGYLKALRECVLAASSLSQPVTRSYRLARTGHVVIVTVIPPDKVPRVVKRK